MKNFLKVTLVCFLTILFTPSLHAQGVNIGFGAGTELPKLELGYSILSKFHVGVYYSPGWTLAFNTPSSFGVFGRYSFKRNEIMSNQFLTASIRPYLGINAGVLHRAAYQDNISYNSGGTVPAKTQFGGSVNGGAEILYGKKASFGTFFEGHVGQMSNYFQSFTNTFNNVLGGNTQKSNNIASVWGFIVGFRFYFGSKEN
jgi:hypothetical protein